MAGDGTLKIGSEDEALKYLSQALAGQFENTHVDVEFANWPIMTIRATGKGYDSTITPDMAEALVDLQHSMNRAYARFVHNSPNARVLTAEERQSIQFKAKVKQGSSLIEVNLGDFADKLTTALVGKMTSTEILIAVLGFAVVAGSLLAFKAFLKAKSEDKKVDLEFRKSVALSQQETRRLEVVTQALSAQPRLQATQQDFDDSRREILKSVGDAKTLEVNGVEMENATARTIASTPRSSSKDIQLNGNYRIFKIDWQQPDNVRLWLGGGDRDGEFIATLNKESITDEHRELLKESEWSRKSLYMQINATELRGEITTARIASVSWPRQPRTKLRQVDTDN